MDILDRYLVREFVVFFTTILLGLAVLFLGIDFFSSFWKMNLPLAKLFAYYAFRIPDALNKFIPVATLMATLLLLSSMSRQNEILALYTGGMGIFRLSSTLIAVVSVICTVSFLVFDSLIPACQKKQILIRAGMDTSQENLITFYPNRYWYRSKNLIYNIGRYIAATNTLEEINVYAVNDSFEVTQKIRARRAQFIEDDWTLEDGFSVSYSIESNYPIAEAFKTKRGIIPEKPSHFKKFSFESLTLKLKDLRQHIERNKVYGLDTTVPELNYHERLALVFSPLIFILIGIPFSTRPLRSHSMAKGIGYCFLIVFLYLICFRFSLTLGKGHYFPPIFAGWITNVVFLTYAIARIVKR